MKNFYYRMLGYICAFLFLHLIVLYIGLAEELELVKFQNRSLVSDNLRYKQLNELEIVKLYKEEIKYSKEKLKKLNTLPKVNINYYLQGKMILGGVDEIDNKILKVRSERLRLEKEMFWYKSSFIIE